MSRAPRAPRVPVDLADAPLELYRRVGAPDAPAYLARFDGFPLICRGSDADAVRERMIDWRRRALAERKPPPRRKRKDTEHAEADQGDLSEN